MASRLWMTRCRAALRATLLSPAVQTTVTPIAAAPSPTVFRRMYCTDQPDPLLKLERRVKMDKENEVRSEKEAKGDIKPMAGFYNPSHKLLIACGRDFRFAVDLASQLGDARNIVIISPYSCGEMNECHMETLTQLGATILFNVDLEEYAEEHHTSFDQVLFCEV